MNTCTGVGKYGSWTRHEEVVYDSLLCPVCDVIEKLVDANLAIETQDKTIEDLRARVALAEAPFAVEVWGRPA